MSKVQCGPNCAVLLCASKELHLSVMCCFCWKQVDKENGEKDKIEYRVWNPFRSKLAAGILAGVDNIYIKPGCKLLYLGAASGEFS